MTEFDAYFYDNKFYLKGKKEFTLGEILTKYLSKNFKDLDYMLYRCRNFVKDLHYPEDIAEGRVCDEMFHSAMAFYSEVETLMFSLPPYNSMNLQKDRLFDILNEYDWFWTDEGNGDYYERDFTEHFNVDITLDDFYDADALDNALELNRKLEALAIEYATFIEDLVRLEKVYKPFLEKLHTQCRYLDNAETAAIVEEFVESTQSKTQSYDKLEPSGNIRLTYTTLEKKKTPILCESYHFNTIGAFLYIELFKGLEQHYLPIKCGHCGRYFLLESGKFSQYCTRPIRGNEDKVCRDVGFREKYSNKIKSDPIWLIYSRAYKQHYARYLKKKMSQAEFQKWADYALELRQKAVDGKLELEEYKSQIRK
ncbi:MAG: hypothetical protein K2N38_13555 [Oscillospiraceae bacterium]|nr:hypothetical protein [Oscillospiraceae bacterium]